ncbi:MAG TPA: Fic family protein [Terracidiphilus sp.]|nr:Fic family protein [Terracidiphilus sp.]
MKTDTELQLVETPLAMRRLLELQHRQLRGNFDTPHLQAIHRHLFQDIYPWAGELRTVRIAKPGALFPLPQYLKQGLDALFAELAKEDRLKNLSIPDWAHRAAYYLGEINAIHPFREGNGRTQREFIRQLGRSAGHHLSWEGFDQEGMIRASQASFAQRDYSALQQILLHALRPGE